MMAAGLCFQKTFYSSENQFKDWKDLIAAGKWRMHACCIRQYYTNLYGSIKTKLSCSIRKPIAQTEAECKMLVDEAKKKSTIANLSRVEIHSRCSKEQKSNSGWIIKHMVNIRILRTCRIGTLHIRMVR